MVGVGVMGRNLLQNMADHEHSVAGYDKDPAKVAALRQEAENRDIRGAADLKEVIGSLRQPRTVMMLVPAGPPVDAVIKPANLIEAQRDYFGAHTYERIDAKGTFHTKWEEDERH